MKKKHELRQEKYYVFLLKYLTEYSLIRP